MVDEQVALHKYVGGRFGLDKETMNKDIRIVTVVSLVFVEHIWVSSPKGVEMCMARDACADSSEHCQLRVLKDEELSHAKEQGALLFPRMYFCVMPKTTYNIQGEAAPVQSRAGQSPPSVGW
ncbi:hypothetical protein BTVI_153016 [Pitangus sulphuratus]|nr:hypothetical protein BTVI_153016 [Pitangus sulphuratus]